MPRHIPPKVVVGTFAGQRYTCTFDPISKTWVWSVEYVRKYPRFGAATTSSYAALHARRFITKMNRWTIMEEESE